MLRFTQILLLIVLFSVRQFAYGHAEFEDGAEDFRASASLYGFSGDNFYSVDPNNGQLGYIASGYKATQEPVFANGLIYAIVNGNLIQIDPSTGYSAILYQNGFTRLTFFNGQIYAIRSNSLWVLDPKNSSSKILGQLDIWRGATSMAASGDRLFIIQNDRLHAVNPSSGAYSVLGSDSWRGYTRMKFYAGNLYVTQNGTLHRVNPANGAWVVLGRIGDWEGAESIAVVNGSLYITQRDSLHKVNPSNGAWQVIGGIGQTKSMILVGP